MFLMLERRMALLRSTFAKLSNNIMNRHILSVLGRRRTHGANPTEEKPIKTLADIKKKLAEKMDQSTGFERKSQEKTALYELLPTSQEELPERTMDDSYDECLVALSKGGKMQNRYATVKGYVRVGRILEDMDMLAVWLCLKFIKNPKSEHSKITPYTIVTIRVDDISFEWERPRVWNDLRLSGHVVWSGKTSMEARILVHFLDGKVWKPYTKAYFVMAARNAATGRGAFVNKLSPKKDFEQEQWERALARKKRRQIEATVSLLKNPPKAEEQQMIFEKFMRTVDMTSITENLGKRRLPENNVWIIDTKSSTEIHPHPEFRNHHNTFFGGTLMRLANEIAWQTAYAFAGERPQLVFISKVEFRVPVPLDSFLKYTAVVTHTDQHYACVTVFSEIKELTDFKTKITNSFHLIYTFRSPKRQLLPSSYTEALLHVQSIRYFEYYRKEFLTPSKAN